MWPWSHHVTSQFAWLPEDTLYAASKYDPGLAPHSYRQDTLNAIPIGYTPEIAPLGMPRAEILAHVCASIPTCSTAPKVVDVFMCSLSPSSVATDRQELHHLRTRESSIAHGDLRAASPANNPLVHGLTFRLATQTLAQPSSKRSSRRVIDATLMHFAAYVFSRVSYPCSR